MQPLRMLKLDVSRYRFAFEAVEPVHLPVFFGSAWRGAFGTALKRTVCVTRLHHCDDCPLIGSCCFPYLFEGRRPATAQGLRSLQRVPVPYVFHPSPEVNRAVAPGETVDLDVSLVGRANQSLIYVVHALAQAGAGGVGPGRGRLSLERAVRLEDMENESGVQVFTEGQFRQPGPARNPSPTPNRAERLLVEIRTPLRLKLDGRLVRPESFQPSMLADASVRRISALAAFHSDAPIESDFRDLKRRAGMLSMQDASLRWEEWKRRSSRQDQVMAMGGLIGRFTLEVPEEASALLDWLELVQWVGVGKGASMGLGQIALRPLGDEV